MSLVTVFPQLKFLYHCNWSWHFLYTFWLSIINLALKITKWIFPLEGESLSLILWGWNNSWKPIWVLHTKGKKTWFIIQKTIGPSCTWIFPWGAIESKSSKPCWYIIHLYVWNVILFYSGLWLSPKCRKKVCGHRYLISSSIQHKKSLH